MKTIHHVFDTTAPRDTVFAALTTSQLQLGLLPGKPAPVQQYRQRQAFPGRISDGMSHHE
ncbi:MAG TPA: hypothetical protein VGS06_27250 [Streptosporangiaceae bacterium]|nr:hypothetical protein [Streptosporangiaceae bacterium]